MRLDLVLSEVDSIKDIANSLVPVIESCSLMANSNHIVIVEANTASEAARYCSFLRVLRRQLVPGLDLEPFHVTTILGELSKKRFFEFQFLVRYSKYIEVDPNNQINGWSLNVTTGRVSPLAYTNKSCSQDYINGNTCARYRLREDFFSILKRTAGPKEKVLFGQTLFDQQSGECYDENLHNHLSKYIFQNRTNGNVTASQYFQEIYLLAETTRRRVVGYQWESHQDGTSNDVIVTWLFQGEVGDDKRLWSRTVDLNYANFDKVVPFIKKHVDRFLEGIAVTSTLGQRTTDLVDSDRLTFARKLEKYIEETIPSMSKKLDWNALALPKVSAFKVPELTMVFEKYKHITLLLDSQDEAKIAQVSALYETVTTALTVFISDRLDTKGRERYESFFSRILPPPSGLERKEFYPFFGDPKRRSTVVSVFGEEFYEFQKQFKGLSKVGVYVNETLFIDVGGFMCKEKKDLTLVCVGLMRGTTVQRIPDGRYKE